VNLANEFGFPAREGTSSLWHIAGCDAALSVRPETL